MRAQTVHFWIGLLIAGGMLAACGDRDHDKNLSEITPITFERVIKEAAFEKTKEVNLAERDSNYQAGIFKKFGQNYYIADTRANRIYIYNTDLEKEQSIGYGTGRGPGEIERLNDYIVDENNIWALDMGRQAIHRFNPDGDYISTIQVKGNPFRLAGFHGEFVTAVMGTGVDSLFKLISPDGEEKGMFGNFTEDQAQNMMGTTGEIVADDNYFIYVPQHASLIYIFNENVELEEVIQTPDGQDFPAIDRSQSGDITIFRAPESPFEALDVYLGDEKLYVMVYEREGTNAEGEKDGIWNNYIDVYDIQKGEYLYSYKTDTRFPDFVLEESKGELCTLDYDDILTCYRVIEK